MKLLTAVIAPADVHRITAALDGAGLMTTTVASAQASGIAAGRNLQYKGVEYLDRRCVRLEVLLDDSDLEVAIALVSPPSDADAVVLWVSEVEGGSTMQAFARSGEFVSQS